MNKIEASRYEPLKILEKVGNNACKLTIPTYMSIYLLNVENLKLYEPSMLNEDEEGQVLHFTKKLLLGAHAKLAKDTILHNVIIMTARGP
jgi:hypothetical protein